MLELETSMRPYPYQKLDAGEIRLLEFQSLHSQKLNFNILHKKLDTLTTSYIALSYTWDTPIFKESISIGDTRFAITMNLHNALLHIQQYLATQSRLGPLMLWVDAICIDQENKGEKSIQVPRMSAIYNKAKYVYVWLGVPESDNVHSGVEKMNYLYELGRAAQSKTSVLRPWWWPRRPTQGNDWTPVFSSMVNKNAKKIIDIEGTSSHNAWRGIFELWQSPWWKRTWIMQEATIKENSNIQIYMGIQAKAPTPKVIFFCGSDTTNWLAILFSVQTANILLKMPLLRESTSFLKGAAANVVRVAQVRDYRRLDYELNLLEQLQRGRSAECSDPRDKIYGSLGMLPDTISTLITADYSKSILEVYTEIPRISLEQTIPTLDFLGYAMKLDSPRRQLSSEISHEHWPSWVPNWDDPLNIFPLAKALYTEVTEQGRSFNPFNDHIKLLRKRTIRGKAYNATRNQPVHANIHNRELHVRGALVDIIMDRYSYQTPSVAEKREIINRWTTAANKIYPNGENFRAALVRVEVADVQHDHMAYAIYRGNSLNNDLLNKRHADLTDEEEKAQVQMRNSLNSASSLRGLCYTKRGYLGLVPWHARIGDHICLLLGGQVLYVLRPIKDSLNNYYYIGESYVHALMDGEALDWVMEGNSTIEEFVLI